MVAPTEARALIAGETETGKERLARLLLVWSDPGAKTASSAHCRLSLTHQEIGELIGASRETVTRALSTFKHRRLVSQHGRTLTIPSRNALEAYARGEMSWVEPFAARSDEEALQPANGSGSSSAVCTARWVQHCRSAMGGRSDPAAPVFYG